MNDAHGDKLRHGDEVVVRENAIILSRKTLLTLLLVPFVFLGVTGLAVYHDIVTSRNARHEQAVRARIQIARADLDLCTKLYSQFVRLEGDSAKQNSVAFYHKILPSVPITDIQNLVHQNAINIAKVKKSFDPAQCKDLPSQHIDPDTGA